MAIMMLAFHIRCLRALHHACVRIDVLLVDHVGIVQLSSTLDRLGRAHACTVVAQNHKVHDVACVECTLQRFEICAD